MKRHKSLGNLRRSLSTLYLRLSGTTSLAVDKNFSKKYFKGPLSDEIAESIKHRWSTLLNDPSLTIVAVQLSKFKNYPGLGISLEGTVDVLDTGVEVRPHHYIRGIQAEGPVAMDGTLQPHDEMLEVNGKKLYGLNHLEVVEILKTLPKHVRIVCARRIEYANNQTALNDVTASESDSIVDIDQMDDDDLMTTRVARPAGLSNDDGDDVADTATLPSRGHGAGANNKSQSFDDFSKTGYWSANPTVVELDKTPAGLGFSVLDYQDPLSSEETVIIIRSLVPGGAAHRDGRLLPGDRLLFVNETNLERASLEETVRCLKSAPRGPIVIGVAKPRPLTSAATDRKIGNFDDRRAGSGRRQKQLQQLKHPQLRKSNLSTPQLWQRQTNHLNQPHQQQQQTGNEHRPLQVSSSSVSSRLDSIEEDFAGSDTCLCEHARALRLELTNSLEPDFLTDEQLGSPTANHRIRPRDSVDFSSLTTEEDPYNSETPSSEVLNYFSAQIVQQALSTVLAQLVSEYRPRPHPSTTSTRSSLASTLSPLDTPALEKDEVSFAQHIVAKAIEAARNQLIGQDQPSEQTKLHSYASSKSSMSSSSLDSLASSSSSGDMLIELERVGDCGSDTDALFNHQELLDAEAEIDDEEDELAMMRTTRQVAFSAATSVNYFSGSAPPKAPQQLKFQLPQSMERCIRITPRPGDTLDLGLVVETVDSGVNGCIVRRVQVGGIAHAEGSLQACDFVTAVNSDSLRQLTTSEARERLRCAGALGQDLFIRYYSAADISRYMASMNWPQSFREESTPGGQHSRYEYAMVHWAEKPFEVEPIIYLDEDEQALAEAVAPAEEDAAATTGEPHHEQEQQQEQEHVKDPKSIVPSREKSLSLDGSPANANASSWSQPRLVRLHRDANRSLGVSIVGGRVKGHDLQQQGVSGVFIKHVSETESGGKREGVLRTGDRILAVCGHDLTQATHDEAVNLIRNAPSPVEFCVQSVLNPSCDCVLLVLPSDSESTNKQAVLTPEPLIAEVPSWDSLDEADGTPHLSEPNNRDGLHVTPELAGCDEFGYALTDPDKQMSLKYPDYESVRLLAIEKSGRRNLGLALAGHRDPGQMSVFVCGIRPDGAAAADGRLKIGDQLLEVNGQSLIGKSHLNAAPVIAQCGGPIVKLVVARSSNPLNSMAVQPLQPPESLPLNADEHMVKPVKPIEKTNAALADESKIKVENPSSQELPTSNGDAVKIEEDSVGSGKNAAASSPQQPADLEPAVGGAGKYGVEITCTLIKGKQGLGFAIMEGNAEDQPGIYVKHITDKGPAATEGSLRTGDRLIKANEYLLAEATYDEALEKLRSMSGQVVITVARSLPTSNATTTTSSSAPSASVKATEAPATASETLADSASTLPTKTKQRKEVRIALPPEAQPNDVISLAAASDHTVESAAISAIEAESATASKAAGMVRDAKEKGESPAPESHSGSTNINANSGNPATCQIVAGKETLIEIDKGSNSLGLSIVGGSDTTLNAIVIHEVYDTGAAWKDRRLWAGDQILSVDDRDLSNVTHEEAKNILLQAGPRVRLKVWRDDKEITEDDLYDKLRIELTRRPGMGLGFSIVARSNDEGVLVSDIIKGGVAESDKRLQPGDRILEINGKDMRKTPHSEVATILKSSQGKVSFLIGRLKHVGVVKSKRKAAFTMHEVNLAKIDDPGRSGSGRLGFQLTAQPSHMTQTASSQAVAVQGAAAASPALSGAAPHQGIFIGPIELDSPAMKSGKIRLDDELVSVNEQSVEGMAVEEANQLIDNLSRTGSVLLRLRRWEEPTGRLTVKLSRNSSRHGMLGFSIVGGRGTPQGDHPIYVRTVTEESAAKNLLFKGDRIDFVNGRPLDGVTHDEAVAILKSVVGDMTLVIHRPAATSAS